MRIRYAPIVTHFLAIWQNLVYCDDHYKFTTNFITRKTYIDIMLICYMRDDFPNKSIPWTSLDLIWLRTFGAKMASGWEITIITTMLI